MIALNLYKIITNVLYNQKEFINRLKSYIIFITIIYSVNDMAM